MEIFLTVGIGVFVLAVLGALVSLYPCIDAFKWSIVFVGTFGFLICFGLLFTSLIENFKLFIFRRFTDRRLEQADDLLKSDLESTWGSSACDTFGRYDTSPGSFPLIYGFWRFHVDRVIYEAFFPETKNENRPFRKGNLPKLEQMPGKHDLREFLKDDIAHLKNIRKEKQKEDFKSKIKFWHLLEILFKGEWGYWKGTYGTKG